jgi:hypothetical protein
MHYRPAIRGQLGQFTIIGLSVNEPQGIVPCRIDGWQPFKGMQAHTPCPPSGQGVSRVAGTNRLDALKERHHKRSILLLPAEIKT